MPLTFEEQQRLENIELKLAEIQEIINGAASLNALNRLLVLCNKEIAEMTELDTATNTKLDTLISLAQKLQ